MALRTFDIDEETYADLSESGGGVCLSCGDMPESGIEPDARNYECDCCGERQVFGLEEALIMGRITFHESDES